MAKKLLRWLATIVIPFVGAFLIRIIYLTTKKTLHYPKHTFEGPCVIGFWHGDLLMAAHNYNNWREHPNAVTMISEHFDGELIAKIMEIFGFEPIRGSSRRGAARVLMQAIKKVKEGYDLGLTPDGPRGPRFSVADGIVAVAQKLDIPIVLQNTVPDRYWQLGSWDRFVIPKPFCHLEFFCSDPIWVTDMKMEDAKKLIHDKLMQKSIV